MSSSGYMEKEGEIGDNSRGGFPVSGVLGSPGGYLGGPGTDSKYSALGGAGLNRYSIQASGGLGQGMREDEFAIQNEDFPALPGSQGPGGGLGRGGEGLSLGAHSFQPDPPGSQGFLKYNPSKDLPGLQSGGSLQPPVGQPSHLLIGGQMQGGQQRGQGPSQQQGIPAARPLQQQGDGQGWRLDAGQGQLGGGPTAGARSSGVPTGGFGQSDNLDAFTGSGAQAQHGADGASSKEALYGLVGLISVIQMSDKDLSALALGVDLLTLGLNLNSQDSLYSLFTSPFTDQPTNMEAQYVTPQCYLMPPPQSPQLRLEHFPKYKMESLFYMFYTAPHDVKQACAAQELYRREWRYHGELMIWMKPRSPQELMAGHPTVPFVYFDATVWEARLFTNAYRGNLVAGLLSEEDVRVKIPQQGPLKAAT